MQKIVIIGYSGAGKSTFATKLAEELGDGAKFVSFANIFRKKHKEIDNELCLKSFGYIPDFSNSKYELNIEAQKKYNELCIPIMNDFVEREMKYLEEQGCKFLIIDDAVASELDFYRDDKVIKIHIINDREKRHVKVNERIRKKHVGERYLSNTNFGAIRDEIRGVIINKGKATDYTYSHNYDSETMDGEVKKLAMFIKNGFSINRALPSKSI